MSEEELEAKAKAMGGYMNKEEWVAKGKDPEQWRSPEEFIERGENILPILQDKLKKTEEELSAQIRHTKSEIDKMKAENEKEKKEAFEKATKEYEQKLKDIKAQKREARKAEDWNLLEEAEEAEEELKAPKPVVVEPKAEIPEDFVAWHAENSWWDTDRDMQDFARAVSSRIQMEQRLPDGRELYDKVTAEVKRVFPDKFKNSKRDEPGAVEGAKPEQGSTNGKKYNNLPADAKATYKRLADKYRLQGFDFDKEDYAKEYFAQEA